MGPELGDIIDDTELTFRETGNWLWSWGREDRSGGDIWDTWDADVFMEGT